MRVKDQQWQTKLLSLAYTKNMNAFNEQGSFSTFMPCWLTSVILVVRVWHYPILPITKLVNQITIHRMLKSPVESIQCFIHTWVNFASSSDLRADSLNFYCIMQPAGRRAGIFVRETKMNFDSRNNTVILNTPLRVTDIYVNAFVLPCWRTIF